MSVLLYFTVASQCSGQSVEQQANGWKAGVRFPEGEVFSRLQRVQTGSGAHPTPYPVGTRELGKTTILQSDHTCNMAGIGTGTSRTQI
jgi:hypothetical protein